MFGLPQSVQCLTTDWTAGVRSPTQAEEFSSTLCVRTGSGAHPASCTMCTGGKARPGRDADHSPPSSAEVKNELELYLLSPKCASMERNGTLRKQWKMRTFSILNGKTWAEQNKIRRYYRSVSVRYRNGLWRRELDLISPGLRASVDSCLQRVWWNIGLEKKNVFANCQITDGLQYLFNKTYTAYKIKLRPFGEGSSESFCSIWESYDVIAYTATRSAKVYVAVKWRINTRKRTEFTHGGFSWNFLERSRWNAVRETLSEKELGQTKKCFLGLSRHFTATSIFAPPVAIVGVTYLVRRTTKPFEVLLPMT
jgi:hypothetical protein